MTATSRTAADVAKGQQLRDDYLTLADKAMKLAKSKVKKGVSAVDQSLAMDGVGVLFKYLGKQQQLISLFETYHRSKHAEDKAEAKKCLTALKRLESKMASELDARRKDVREALNAL